MFCCNNCKKSFKTNWQLQRHLGKKNKCKPNLPNLPNVPVDGVKVPNFHIKSTEVPYQVSAEGVMLPNFHEKSTEVPAESKTEHVKSSVAVDSLTCEYCLVTFANKKNLRLHGQRCKLKEDHVRCMEIELNKNVNKWSKNECRFCGYHSSQVYCVTRHLPTCKKRKEYKAALEEELRWMHKVCKVLSKLMC